MRSLLKTGALALVYAALRMRELAAGRQPYALVLMYHSVEESDWKYGVSPDVFRRQLAYLARHYRVVPLADTVAYARGERELAEPEIAITIDDGYLDTYEVVFPILKEFGLPATVFLTSDLSPRPALGGLPRPTEAQVREMADSDLVTFEVHGREHKNLAALDAESAEFYDEVAGCREDVMRMTGREPRFIAYAAGNRSRKTEVRVRELGFAAGFGITEGTVHPGDNRFALRRVQIDRTMPFPLFALRTTRAIDAYRSLVSTLRTLFRKCATLLRTGSFLDVYKPKEGWESQFERGYWSFLLDAQPNTAAIARTCAERARELDRAIRIVDLGCGNGALGAALATEGVRVGSLVGVDISETALATAREAHPEGRYAQYDLRSELPPLVEADVIVCNEVLYYLAPLAFLRRLRRATPRGVPVVFSFYRSWRRPFMRLLTRLFFRTTERFYVGDGADARRWCIVVSV